MYEPYPPMFYQQNPNGYYQQMVAQQLMQTPQQRQQQNQMPPINGFQNMFGGGGLESTAQSDIAANPDIFGSSGGTGMSNWAGGATPLLYAYLIGKGKMMENNRLSQDPNDPMGNLGLAMLAPSFNQIKEDPKGMGLPTLLGVPFLTPFTASDKSKQTKPEWSGLWNSLGL